MKKVILFNILGCALTVIIFAGCHFSAGVKKDLKTGLSVSYNGFEVNEVYLADKAGKPLPNNKVFMDSTFSIIAKGVDNYKLKDGKAYPGCELTIKDKNGKVLGGSPDVMEGIAKDGLIPKNATVLSAILTLHHPFVVGETYHVAARFFDKENAKNELKADIDILLQ